MELIEKIRSYVQAGRLSKAVDSLKEISLIVQDYDYKEMIDLLVFRFNNAKLINGGRLIDDVEKNKLVYSILSTLRILEDNDALFQMPINNDANTDQQSYIEKNNLDELIIAPFGMVDLEEIFNNYNIEKIDKVKFLLLDLFDKDTVNFITRSSKYPYLSMTKFIDEYEKCLPLIKNDNVSVRLTKWYPNIGIILSKGSAMKKCTVYINSLSYDQDKPFLFKEDVEHKESQLQFQRIRADFDEIWTLKSKPWNFKVPIIL